MRLRLTRSMNLMTLSHGEPEKRFLNVQVVMTTRKMGTRSLQVKPTNRRRKMRPLQHYW